MGRPLDQPLWLKQIAAVAGRRAYSFAPQSKHSRGRRSRCAAFSSTECGISRERQGQHEPVPAGKSAACRFACAPPRISPAVAPRVASVAACRKSAAGSTLAKTREPSSSDLLAGGSRPAGTRPFPGTQPEAAVNTVLTTSVNGVRNRAILNSPRRRRQELESSHEPDRPAAFSGSKVATRASAFGRWSRHSSRSWTAPTPEPSSPEAIQLLRTAQMTFVGAAVCQLEPLRELNLSVPSVLAAFPVEPVDWAPACMPATAGNIRSNTPESSLCTASRDPAGVDRSMPSDEDPPAAFVRRRGAKWILLPKPDPAGPGLRLVLPHGPSGIARGPRCHGRPSSS